MIKIIDITKKGAVFSSLFYIIILTTLFSKDKKVFKKSSAVFVNSATLLKIEIVNDFLIAFRTFSNFSNFEFALLLSNAMRCPLT